MIPKTHKYVLKKVLEKANDKTFAEDAISFYWSEVRKNLSDMTYHSITVNGLGIFNIKHWKVDDFLKSYEHLIQKKAYTYKMASKKKVAEKNYQILLRIKKEYEEEDLRKQAKKLERLEYEINKNLEQ